jgi:hypothetical protein
LDKPTRKDIKEIVADMSQLLKSFAPD